MSLLAALTLAAPLVQAPEPVLWVTPQGAIMVEGKAVQATFSPGTKWAPTGRGKVLDFDGNRSGVLLADQKALQFNDSFTVSTWINLRSYKGAGQASQILFRGDDRNGLDPFTLVVHDNRTVNFGLDGGDTRRFHVGNEVPLGRWQWVVTNWDSATGRLTMYVNGNQVAFGHTSIRPIMGLDGGWAPGIGIGNVQNEKGPHNQPLNGQIGDLRVYRGLLTPQDIDSPRPAQNAAGGA